MASAPKRFKFGTCQNIQNFWSLLDWVESVYKVRRMRFQLPVTKWILDAVYPEVATNLNDLQTIGAATMLIISKFIGDPIPVERLVYWSDSAYDLDDLKRCEIFVLKYLVDHKMIGQLSERCYDSPAFDESSDEGGESGDEADDESEEVCPDDSGVADCK